MQRRLMVTLMLLMLWLLNACGSNQQSGQLPTPVVAAPAPEQATAAPTNVAATEVASAPTAAPTAIPPTPTLGPGMYVNPVIRQDFPDPDSLKVGDTYYAYATGNFDAKISVKTARSKDLITWELLPDAMPTFPAWTAPDHGLVWAPEVTTSADGTTYLLYFTARVLNTTTQCIGLATSDKPEGPFVSQSKEPMICQRNQGGSIDASSFVDEDGTRYLLWKNDGNCCGGKTWIYIQQISADGQTLEGEPTQLFHADQGWEGILVEAPTLWKHNGKYYLFYSANDYSTPRYSIGYAVADSPLGPYTKAEKPLVISNIRNGVVGPGGQDIVLDEDGNTWMLYHSWGPGYRTMNINQLLWEGDVPKLDGPSGKIPEDAPPTP